MDFRFQNTLQSTAKKTVVFLSEQHQLGLKHEFISCLQHQNVFRSVEFRKCRRYFKFSVLSILLPFTYTKKCRVQFFQWQQEERSKVAFHLWKNQLDTILRTTAFGFLNIIEGSNNNFAFVVQIIVLYS